MNPQEAYLERVNRFLDSLPSILSADERARVDHLIEHDEPAEGLLTLAWIIYNERKKVSKEIVSTIYALTGTLVLKEHFPPGFEKYAS